MKRWRRGVAPKRDGFNTIEKTEGGSWALYEVSGPRGNREKRIILFDQDLRRLQRLFPDAELISNE